LKITATHKILSCFRIWWVLLVSHGKQVVKIAKENIVCIVIKERNLGRT
jgi:hypothetical protein